MKMVKKGRNKLGIKGEGEGQNHALQEKREKMM
jgi:hypothetical protein